LPNLISIGCGDGERVTEEVETEGVKRVEEVEKTPSPRFFRKNMILRELFDVMA
jgi:hypothetical protein